MLRIARTGTITADDQGLELPIGNVPAWVIARVLSLVLGIVGCYPMLRAVLPGQVYGGTIVAQLAFSAVLLPVYIQLAAQSRR
ncbi:MAG TPA: hypothetical protein VG164_06735 [Trebonia sp.]|nr:hypothetical protein [Trebonia sp.]